MIVIYYYFEAYVSADNIAPFLVLNKLRLRTIIGSINGLITLQARIMIRKK